MKESDKTLHVMGVLFLIGVVGLVLVALHTAWWLPFSAVMFILSFAAHSLSNDERAKEDAEKAE